MRKIKEPLKSISEWSIALILAFLLFLVSSSCFGQNINIGVKRQVTSNSIALDTQDPTPPTVTLTDSTTTTFTISWSGATDNVGVTSYDIYLNGSFDSSQGGTTKTFTGLTENTAYTAYVLAVDAANNKSVASNTINVTTEVAPAQTLKAFPTAYGGGSQATGGRGKPIYIVTNLNDTGAGSFIQALNDTKATQGGNIVFEVSGTVNLTSCSYSLIDVENVTIAGQTSPLGGVTIANNKMKWTNFNNVIIRYIRWRPQYNACGNIPDAFQNFNCNNMIYDHCSWSYGGDEAFSFTAPLAGNTTKNITVQKSILGESKTGMLLGDSNNPERNDSLSFHNNLTYNITHRFPNISTDGYAEIVNNLIYNWDFRLTVQVGDAKINYINNYIQEKDRSAIAFSTVNMLITTDGGANYNPRVYADGNIYGNNGSTAESWVENPNADNWKLFRYRDITDPYDDEGNPLTEGTYRVLTPYGMLGDSIPIKSAVQARTDILANVGANAVLDENGTKIDSMDAVDYDAIQRIINDNPKTYTNNDYTGDAEYIAFHATVSTTPINTHSGTRDTDSDGMPDAWETATFGDLTRDGTGDFDADGYTDLEEFFNLVDL